MKTNGKKGHSSLVRRGDGGNDTKNKEKKSEKNERQGDLGLVRGGDGGNDAR